MRHPLRDLFRITVKEGAAFASLLRSAWREYEADYARYFAKAMVYHALVSLVPLILLLLASIGLLLRLSDTAALAEQRVLELVEGSFGAPLRTTIQSLLQRLEQGSVVATAVSLIGLLVTGAALFRHLRMTFRAIWRHVPPLVSGGLWNVVRAVVLEQLIAFAMVLIGGVLLIAAFGVIVAAQSLAGFAAGLPVLGGTVASLLTLLAPFIVVWLTFALLFKFLPPVRLRWGDVWLASVLCAVAWTVGARILALYGSALGGRFGAYGAVGGVLVVMWWMSLVSQMLFYGAELCKVTAQRGASRESSGASIGQWSTRAR